MSPTSNIVLARLVYVYPDETQNSKEIKHIFLSGLPGIEPTAAAEALSEISEPASIKGYELTFLAKSFKNGSHKELVHDSGNHQAIISQIKHELHNLLHTQNSLIGERRRENHKNNIDTQSHVYFHSEQALRRSIVNDICSYQEQQEDILSFIKRAPEYVILDLCSRYDVCRCCADTLVIACEKEEILKDVKVFIRASGTTGYPEISPAVGKKTQLRDSKHYFPTYSDSAILHTLNPYTPYIAHTAAPITAGASS